MTMDELARQLGCSKKTIYEHYTDKKILVHRVLGSFLEEHRSEMQALELGSRNAVENLLRMAATGLQKMRNLTPTMLFDLQKSYPELWTELESYRQVEIAGIFKRLIVRGQREGLFRPEIDAEIVLPAHGEDHAGADHQGRRHPDRHSALPEEIEFPLRDDVQHVDF
jgi:excisionase family DNA binding protein